MCVKSPKPPKVQSQPRRDEKANIVQENRRHIKEQRGVYGNIATSPLGDSTYGTNIQKFATFGARAA